MRIKRTALLIGVVYILGLGALTLYSYIRAYLESIALPITTPVGRGILLLPAVISAVLIGSALALVTRTTFPEQATTIALLALTPTIALILSAIFGTEAIWWMELCDAASLLFFTYFFVTVRNRWASRDNPISP